MHTEDQILEIGARALENVTGEDMDDCRWDMRCVLKSLREAGLEVEQGWRFDMENAPKNREVLLAYEVRGRVVVQSAQLTDAIHEGIYSWCVSDHKFGPYPIRGYVDEGLLAWRPLPAPPATGGEDA